MQNCRQKAEMAKTEHPLQALNQWLPEGSFEKTAFYLEQYKVHLTITRKRKSVLGDFRNATRFSNHRISVNGNLNKYEFLITLIHELAHLLTYEQYGHRISPHGIEWKKMYGSLLSSYLQHDIFPGDIKTELLQSLQKPGASSCSETDLIRILRKYDEKPDDGWLHIENLEEGTLFETQDGKKYIKGHKLRKRFMCTHVASGANYLFNPLCEVRKV